MAELPKHNYELAEQEDFYKQYLPLVNSELDPVDVQVHSTDGLIGDLLLEFKPSIKDLNAVLFQAIKYLSHFRLNGQAVPSNILLISYDEGTAYYYKADNYLPDIEKVYTRAASKDVTGQFVAGDPKAVWHYGDNSVDEDAMIQLMKVPISVIKMAISNGSQCILILMTLLVGQLLITKRTRVLEKLSS